MAGITNNARTQTQILNAYIEQEIAPIYRKSVILGLLKSRGLITFNHGGRGTDWLPEIKSRDITASDISTDITFTANDVFEEPTLGWTRYHMGEKVSKYEKLVSQEDKYARYKVYETAIKQMAKSFTKKFGPKFYSDGNAGTALDLMGLESCLSTSAADVDEPIGLPNDTYAGLDCTLGGLGGSWTGNFPDGSGDEMYHAWSPLIVNYISSLLGGTAATWAAQWQHALGYLFTYMGTMQNVTPDVLLLNAALLNAAKTSLLGNQRFEITQNSEITKLGHKTLNYEGVEIVSEYGIPANSGYALVWDELELRSMQKQLVGTETDFEIASSTDRIAMDFYGQLIINSPAFVGKLASVAAATTTTTTGA